MVIGLDVLLFDGSVKEEHRKEEHYEGTEISFSFDEWAGFFDDLGVRLPSYVYGDDMAKYHREADEMFKADLIDYPMLARSNDYFCDAEYNSQEVHKLLNECNRILPRLTKPLALTFANGLIAGCREAIKRDWGLFLGAD